MRDGEGVGKNGMKGRIRLGRTGRSMEIRGGMGRNEKGMGVKGGREEASRKVLRSTRLSWLLLLEQTLVTSQLGIRGRPAVGKQTSGEREGL